MGALRRSIRASELAVQPDRPLIGIVAAEGGQEVVRYFVDEADADAAATDQVTADARAMAGSWADLDWDDAVETLDRIRHDSVPTPPIEAL